VGLGEVLELEVTQPGLGQLQAVAVAALGTRAEVTAIVQPLIDGLGQGDLGALDQRPAGKIGDDLGPLGPSFLHGAERVAPCTVWAQPIRRRGSVRRPRQSRTACNPHPELGGLPGAGVNEIRLYGRPPPRLPAAESVARRPGGRRPAPVPSGGSAAAGDPGQNCHRGVR
jgi:hypothetical protein